MPSGAKKRKAAKRKNSSTANPHQRDNNGGEVSSSTSQDPLVEVEKRDDNSHENKSKDANEVEVGLKSKGSNHGSSSSSDSSDDESRVVEKNVVVVESARNGSVPAVESVPEKISSVVDLYKPVDSLLEEVSQVFDEMKNERKKDLVVEETPVVVGEQTVVVSETAVKDDCTTSSVVAESVSKENEVEKLISLDEKASSVSNDYVSSSTRSENLISEVNGADCANETDTIGYSNRQATAASPAEAAPSTTTWKSCCGIFELFSRSER